MLSAPVLFEDLGHSLATDYFLLREQLTEEQLELLRQVRVFVDDEVLPVIGGYWERAEMPWALIHRLGELGIVGEDIHGYGCPGLDPIASGLIHMELDRGDGSLGTFLGVRAARRRLLRAERSQALDRVREHRGRRRRLGAGRGRSGPRFPGRARNARLRSRGDRG
jgi:alkylation response protein AidB-like acyl-CoA dehydrogenase